jgi:hypothetical protein
MLVLGATPALALEPARTPEQLIANLVAAAQAGDGDAVLSNLTVESRRAVIASFVDRAALRAGLTQFRSALDQRFGAGGELLEPPPRDLAISIGRVAGAEILSESVVAEGMELQVRTTLRAEDGSDRFREDSLLARQQSGGWRLALGLTTDGGVASAQAAAVERVTQAVRDGAYQDRTEAMVALADAWSSEEAAAR